MKTLIAGSNGLVGSSVIRQILARKALLACGILSSLLYIVANDIIAAMRYPGYSRISQPLSQLSATFAPTRSILVPLLILYMVLMIAFGTGVWHSAQGKRLLRITSVLIITGAIMGLVSLAFPMTQLDLSDTMHNILAGTLTPLLMFVTIGFGVAALGKWFRFYSILTLVVLFLGGVLLSMQTAQIAGGETVAYFGITQRMLTGAWLLWVAALAIVLLRSQPERTRI